MPFSTDLSYVHVDVAADQHGSGPAWQRHDHHHTAADSFGATASKTVAVTLDAMPILQVSPVFLVDFGVACPLGGLRLSDADRVRASSSRVLGYV